MNAHRSHASILRLKLRERRHVRVRWLITLLVLLAMVVPGANLSHAAQDATPLPGEDVVTATFGGGPAHTGEQPGPAPAVVPDQKWAFTTAEGYAGGAIVSAVDGLVFTFGDVVYALTIDTGEAVWSFVAETGLGFVGPLALADGVVYVSGQDGYIYALEAATGSVVWRSQVSAPAPLGSGPLVVDDALYVTAQDGNVHAVDAATGNARWTTPIGGTSIGQPAYADGYVVLPGPRFGAEPFNGLLALRADSGEEAWRFPTDDMVMPGPAIANGTVYFGGAVSDFYAISLGTGDLRWHVETGAPISDTAVSGGTVYVTNVDRLGAYDAETGGERWSLRFDGEMLYGTTVTRTEDGATVVLVGDSAGVLHAIDQGGMEVWSVTVTEASLISPATVIDGIIYIPGQDGTLYALGGPASAGPAPAGTATATKHPDLRLPTPTVAAVPTSTATVAGGQSITVSGATISYAGGWTYDSANSVPDEMALFQATSPHLAMYAYVAPANPTTDVQQAVTEFTGDFFETYGATNVQQVTLEALPGGQAWSLHTADQTGMPIVVLAYADGTTQPGQVRVQVLICRAAEAEAALIEAQATLQIDGVQAFEGLAPTAVGAHLNSSPPPPQAPTPALLPTSTPIAAIPTAPEPYADAGMVAPGHYVSPNTGAEVRWDPAVWDLDPYMSPPVATSYEADEMHLVWLPDDNIWIAVFIFPAYGQTLEDVISYVSSPAEVEAMFGPTAELVLSTATSPRGAMVVRDTGSGFATWMFYSEFYLVNDGTAIVEVRFAAPVPLAEETLAAAQQITLNGQPVMTYYPVQDVLAAVGP
jgi:outer membrane protein assembly factor BamB